jgi:hypothetical protein
MNINKLHDDVYEITDFLSPEELDQVMQLIDSTPEQSWYPEEVDSSDFWYGKNLQIHDPSILDIVNSRMESMFESYHYYPDRTLLQRYRKGDFIAEHRDQWIPDLPYYIGYGFCLYYNDNYEGGQLRYPELDIVVKPKANSLYIHGGNVLHGSMPVTDDRIRYFSTVFVRGTEEEPTILNRELFK